ncbi:hypothetical protein EDC04DRAFT_1051367 [Pisolithus marmoratus]|nr:hypothetical protein EDC04DRAFT_1051367 [Pisolithus marmoratus]
MTPSILTSLPEIPSAPVGRATIMQKGCDPLILFVGHPCQQNALDGCRNCMSHLCVGGEGEVTNCLTSLAGVESGKRARTVSDTTAGIWKSNTKAVLELVVLDLILSTCIKFIYVTLGLLICVFHTDDCPMEADSRYNESTTRKRVEERAGKYAVRRYAVQECSNDGYRHWARAGCNRASIASSRSES